MPVSIRNIYFRARENGERGGCTFESLPVLTAITAGIALLRQYPINHQLSNRPFAPQNVIDQHETLAEVRLVSRCLRKATQTSEDDPLVVGVHLLVSFVTLTPAGVEIGDVKAVGVQANDVRHIAPPQPRMRAERFFEIRLVVRRVRVVQVHGDAGGDIQLVRDGVFVRLQPLFPLTLLLLPMNKGGDRSG